MCANDASEWKKKRIPNYHVTIISFIFIFQFVKHRGQRHNKVAGGSSFLDRLFKVRMEECSDFITLVSCVTYLFASFFPLSYSVLHHAMFAEEEEHFVVDKK